MRHLNAPCLKLSRAFLFTCLTGLTLAGCTNKAAHWSGGETEYRNTVDLVRMTHDVQFDQSTDEMLPDSRNALDRFLKRQDIGIYDALSIDLPLTFEGEILDADLKRKKALTKFLIDQGYTVQDEITPYGAEPRDGTARLIVSRYVVTAPNCGDWRKKAAPDYYNTQTSNFGCTSQSALGMMVANPRDLLEGQENAGPDTVTASKAIENYHTNRPAPDAGAPKGGLNVQ